MNCATREICTCNIVLTAALSFENTHTYLFITNYYLYYNIMIIRSVCTYIQD